MFQATRRRMPLLSPADCSTADPYALRFGIVGAKGNAAGPFRLAIRLEVSRAHAASETFLLSLMPASSGRSIWTFRHSPSYWRIAPLDISVFRQCQALMTSLPTTGSAPDAEWLIAAPLPASPHEETPSSPTMALYLQLAPQAPFILLSKDACRPMDGL
ncbi:hypothetical protein [Dyella koreensis]|uniref:Uncharacterized protein n=1 Tax=Dyella koreensis TaxID=311235 RepID=A0ABW8K7X8_9GAMM